MAGGSQIIISKNGITIITPAKFEAKAGQHLFKNGSNVPNQIPYLPLVSKTDFSQKFEFNYAEDRAAEPYQEVKHLYVYAKQTGRPIHFEDLTDNQPENKHESKRFYTEEEEEIVGLVTYQTFPWADHTYNFDDLSTESYCIEEDNTNTGDTE